MHFLVPMPIAYKVNDFSCSVDFDPLTTFERLLTFGNLNFMLFYSYTINLLPNTNFM